MALSSGQSMNTLICNRCGNTISASVTTYESFTIYCQACNALMSQEMLSIKKKNEQLSMENMAFKQKQDNVDQTISKLKSRTETIEKAYMDEASDRLEIRAQRDWARNAIMFWKSFLDHWKVKASCQFCTANVPCQTMKLIEEQALLATPQWECEDCKKKESDCAVMKTAIISWNENQRHVRNCHECTIALNNLSSCDTQRDLFRTMSRAMSNAENSEAGNQLLNKLFHIIKDFSFLGEGAAIMFDGGVYHVIKLDIRKMKSSDVNYLSVGQDPKTALDKAKHIQTLETLQHSV